MDDELVPKEELQAAIEARKEVDQDLEPALIDAFVERIERRLERGGVQSEKALKAKREHQKEMVLGAMALSIPLFVIAAIFAGLAGVLVVCGVLVVVALVSTRT